MVLNPVAGEYVISITTVHHYKTNFRNFWKDFSFLHFSIFYETFIFVYFIAQNLSCLHNLYILNLSDNFVGNDGKEALQTLGKIKYYVNS